MSGLEGSGLGRKYVHGYSDREKERLCDQANTLAELLHSDTFYREDSLVLEVGCGVGAQTAILARNNPGARIVSIDLSRESLVKARRNLRAEGHENEAFMSADVFDLPFESESFDHVFVCFVLEHLSDPRRGLACLKRVLKEGGSVTVIEGDHGSAYFHPESAEASKAIECLIELQGMSGGNARIGRQLYPLLIDSIFVDVRVSPRMVYVDSSRPEWVEGFTRRTFTAMVEGVSEEVLRRGMMDEKEWKKGIEDLYRTAGPDGTFCYCFFKGTARRRG